MAGCITTLMDRGQWATLERWLGQLPDDALASHPDLIYCKADIAAARGHVVMARQWFDTAASYCAKRNDPAGACRSMLAASVVAADHGDLAAALSHAYGATTLADDTDLPAIQMWASWQQGRVQLASGDTDGALVSFGRAASAASATGESAATTPVQLAGELAAQVGELRRQQESHRQAEAGLRQAEHEALNQLLANARTPAWQSDEVLGAYGWSRTPTPLKLPGLGMQRIPQPARRGRPGLASGGRWFSAGERGWHRAPGPWILVLLWLLRQRPHRAGIRPRPRRCPSPSTWTGPFACLPPRHHPPCRCLHRRRAGATRSPSCPYIC
jgi:hypothetical protein